MPPKAPNGLRIVASPSFLVCRSATISRTRTSRIQSIIQRHEQQRCFGIKSIEKPRFSKYNDEFNLQAAPQAAYQRKLDADVLPLRTGALAVKRGMTAIYDTETGERIPCTVLQLDRNQVVHHKTMKKHGYYAVCVGAGSQNSRNVTKPMAGHFSAQGVPLKRELREFRVRDEKGLLAVGQRLMPSWFMVGQFIDARSQSKGKGFAGVMKKWGFGGQPRSHGHSLSHRSLGSTGNGQGGGSRVYPGKKMPGRMGAERNTVQNVKVLQVHDDTGVVLVKGAVSGPKGCYVMIQDALRKPWPNVPPPPEPSEINKELREAVGAKVGS